MYMLVYLTMFHTWLCLWFCSFFSFILFCIFFLRLTMTNVIFDLSSDLLILLLAQICCWASLLKFHFSWTFQLENFYLVLFNTFSLLIFSVWWTLFSYFPSVFLDMVSLSSLNIFKVNMPLLKVWVFLRNSLYWLTPPFIWDILAFFACLIFCWKLDLLNNTTWQLWSDLLPGFLIAVCCLFGDLL